MHHDSVACVTRSCFTHSTYKNTPKGWTDTEVGPTKIVGQCTLIGSQRGGGGKGEPRGAKNQGGVRFWVPGGVAENPRGGVEAQNGPKRTEKVVNFLASGPKRPKIDPKRCSGVNLA